MRHIITENDNIIFVDGKEKKVFPLNTISYKNTDRLVTFYPVDDCLFTQNIFSVSFPFEINGETVTEENIDEKLKILFVVPSGGGSKIDAYTKTETDALFLSKEEGKEIEDKIDTVSDTAVTSDDVNKIVVGASADYDPTQQDPKTLYILL